MLLLHSPLRDRMRHQEQAQTRLQQPAMRSVHELPCGGVKACREFADFVVMVPAATGPDSTPTPSADSFGGCLNLNVVFGGPE